MSNTGRPIEWNDGVYIGADGCRGGWAVAVLDHGVLRLERHATITELVDERPEFDAFLIDMVIGLRNSASQVRPEDAARRELGPRAATVFTAPSRRAVYADGEDAQKVANIETLGKSLAKQTVNIIPKIREVDEFLQGSPRYRDKIAESHPELDFARLNGSIVMSRKKDRAGFAERTEILARYIPQALLTDIWDQATRLGCAPDDTMDATCLALTASLMAHGACETVPERPQRDECGLYMRFVAPKRTLRPNEPQASVD